MKNKTLMISIFIILFSINLASASFYYNVSVKYSYGNLSINSVEVIFSNQNITSFSGDYYLELKNSKDKLNSYLFSIPSTVTYDLEEDSWKVNQGGVINVNETDFEVFVPYEKNANEIVITDSNKIDIAKKDISYLSKQVVNNQVTKEFETNTPDSTKLMPIETSSNYLIIGLITLIVIVAIIIFWAFRKKSKKK
ncbi:MAG: hypothetical protein WC979_04325 [Candidatus Pacearchaeota archaeon]|jgi:hypothetical protein